MTTEKVLKKRKVFPFLHQMAEKLSQKDIGTFDIETQGLGGTFLQGGVYDGNEGNIVVLFDTIQDMMRYMLSFPKKIWLAHYGGRYDFNYLKDTLLALVHDQSYSVMPIVRGESDFIGYVIWSKDGKRVSQLWDSFAFMPVAEKAFAKNFAPSEFQKKDIGLDRGIIYDKSNPKHQEYLRYDCLALYYAVRGYEKVLHNMFHVNLNMTTGAIAMKAFKYLIPEGHIYNNLRPDEEEFARHAYHGGLVHIGSSRENRGETVGIDIHAAYAGIGMKGKFPTRKGAKCYSYVKGVLGLYHVKVTIPADAACVFFPHEQNGRTLWTCGENLDAYITSEDYERALELGYTVKIIEGYIYPQTEEVFKAFCELNEMLERLYPEIKDAPKNNRNSLYGKFGTRREGEEYAILPEEANNPQWTPYHYGATGNSNVPHVYYKEREIEADYIMPHWAAFITSRVRIALSRVIEAISIVNKAKDWNYDVYTDTDSAYTSPEMVKELISLGIVKIGDKYGEWEIDSIKDAQGIKQDMVFSEFYVFGPKNYIGRTLEGEYKRKQKGLPYREKDAEGNWKFSPEEHFNTALELLAGTRERKDTKQLTKMSMHRGRTLWRRTDGSVGVMRKKDFIVELNSTSWKIVDGKYVHPYMIGK